MQTKAKHITNEVFCILCLAVSLWWQITMRLPDHMEHGFRLAVFGSFLFAVSMLGFSIAFLTMRSETIKLFRGDLWFLTITGFLYLLLTLICFFIYGGLSGSFGKDGYAAVNYMVVILSLLPIPFLAKLTISVFLSEEEKKTLLPHRILCCILLTVFLLAVIFGGLFRTVVYTG